MDKKPLMGVILCFILFFSIFVPITVESKKVDCEVKEETNNRDIYFFSFGFIKGSYNNSVRQLGYFDIWNPDSSNTMVVLGFKPQEIRFVSVNAYHIHGWCRIGFMGPHHCNVFAFGGNGLTVSGLPFHSQGVDF